MKLVLQLNEPAMMAKSLTTSENDAMPKLTFNQALERINDGHAIARAEIRASALRRRVYLLTYCAPGCLPDNCAVFVSRQDALDCARDLYADDAPRGFMRRLRYENVAPADSEGHYWVEISRQTLADCF